MIRIAGAGLSLLINAALLVALQWNGNVEQAAPSGEVQVTQVDASQREVSRDLLFAQTRA
jgi:hypothetical protein